MGGGDKIPVQVVVYLGYDDIDVKVEELQAISMLAGESECVFIPSRVNSQLKRCCQRISVNGFNESMGMTL